MNLLKPSAMSDVLNACSLGQWENANRLFDLDPQASIRFKDRHRWTILHEVSGRSAPFAFVHKLLSLGMDPNFQNLTFRSPLHYALQPGLPIATVMLLLQFGANPNLADKSGNTPVHWAVLENCSVEILHLLLAARGDLTKQDDFNVRLDLLNELLRFGPQTINLCDFEGHNPLNAALLLSSSHVMIQRLLEHGATLDQQRMRVARFHSDPLRFQQVQVAQLFLLLRAPATIKRLQHSSTALSLFPMELFALLRQLLF
ncbi:hypothetical protein BASA81_001406 [Batrachochytrium salamandrivorans]|nr:hypothetical protein BASA81_001406 [Batrachochytrium salamandrivorans]